MRARIPTAYVRCPYHMTRLFLAVVGLALFSVLYCITAPMAWADDRPAPELHEAKSAALIDQGGNVLYAINPDMELPPASITKVMTAMVALDSGKSLYDEVELIAPDLGENSQMADYGQGDKVTFGDLLRIMLVYSANDAAYNVAVITAGSEEAFVGLMNQKAAEIGMTHTHFENSHGLESDHHYSSALDLARMGHYALTHYPFIAQTAMLRDATTTIHGYTAQFVATNKLLGTFPGIRGIKTGAVTNDYTFLGASGRGNIQLYTAVLGCLTFTGRFDDSASLMEWGYAGYGDAQLSHPEWVTAVQPYAYDLGLKAVVSPTDVAQGKTWPTQEGFVHDSHLCNANGLMGVHEVCGWTDWSQSNRHLSSATYASRPTPVRASAWPVMSLPLFTQTSDLGTSISEV